MSQAAKKPRKVVDWEAVERDFRATSMTLRELGEKYGVAHTTIDSRVKREKWTRDLTQAVDLATKSKLIDAAVREKVEQDRTDFVQQGVDAISVMAEQNAGVILRHQRAWREAQQTIKDTLVRVLGFADDVTDVREVKVLADGVSTLMGAMRVATEQERKAHGLDDETDKTSAIDDLLLKAAEQG